MLMEWRSFLKLVTIEVQEEDGVVADSVRVSRHFDAGPTSHHDTDGLLRMLLPRTGGQLTIHPWTRRDVGDIELGLVTGDQIVRFGSGPRLLVALDAVPAMPAGAELLVEVGEASQPLDARGRAALWLPKPGRWQARLLVKRGEQRAPVGTLQGPVDVPVGGAELAHKLDGALRRRIDAAAAKLC